MKKLLFSMFLIVGLLSCGGNQASKPQANNSATASTTASTTATKKDCVEVLYFHGKQRCITCNAIENHTKEIIETYFAQEIKDSTLIFRVIDISTEDGELLAEKYEVTWSSLFINKWVSGQETKNNMTDFGFSCAKSSPDEFKAGVKKKIDELLK